LLQLNCRKANTYLNWKIRWNFKKSINKTAEWYLNYYRNRDMAKFSKNQIKDYFSIK